MNDESSEASAEAPKNQPRQPDRELASVSPGAGGILDVTPVNSFAANDDDEAEESLLTLSNQESLEAARLEARRNEDAFSSSSDDDDKRAALGDDDDDDDNDADDSMDGAPQIPLEEALGQTSERQSEWDKALRKGKSNTGHASKFFSEQKGDDEFLIRADSIVLQEASTAATESFEAPEKSPSSSLDTKPPAGPLPSKQQQQQQQAPPSSTASGFPPSRPAPRENSNNDVLRRAASGGSKYPPAGNSVASSSTISSNNNAGSGPPGAAAAAAAAGPPPPPSFVGMRPHPQDNLSAGVLPDVLIAMRQRLESMTLFDSDMMRLAATSDDDPMLQESIESLKRSFHQSISAAVLVSLSHKRYERRRLAAMEIEKVVRSLLHQGEVERVRAILLLLSDDYVRSTSEDARKGGVVALAACAVGIKKAVEKENPILQECRDLILASVVHACQDHNQRVRYYATESLFNVVKIMPVLAIQHFFILFEILRSLYADVDVDVRSGAELLDKKLKEVIVNAINSGTFTVEACVPVFARFVYIRNKATKRLTLTWLQELSEKLVGAPILEFLHLFLSGIFQMVADPTLMIRQSALAFLQSVLPKILVLNTDTPLEENRMAVDFDKILQSLVTTMEHPDPFVRKVSMYWMSRIVKAHIGEDAVDEKNQREDPEDSSLSTGKSPVASAAAVSVRNSVPHLLPGILLSIGDTYDGRSAGMGSNKDSFLPDQTTRSLAEQTSRCLQASVRRDGEAYVQHLDGFIQALREELDSPGGLNSRHTDAVDRSPYRMDVNLDGTGIERPGWFRESEDEEKPSSDDSLIMSRLCALHWIIVLYESVVPDLLKADYAREFVYAIIHQFVHNPPKEIIRKSLEVLARITIIVPGEEVNRVTASSMAMAKLGNPAWAASESGDVESGEWNEGSIEYALGVLGSERKKQTSRDREVFWALIQLHSYNENLLQDLTSVITYMCELQPSEFVMISFAVELDRFIRKKSKGLPKHGDEESDKEVSRKDLKVVSSVVQHMSQVLLNAEEARDVRNALKDCIGSKGNSERDRQLTRVFHILLHSFSHNLASTLSLCLWCGAYRTASLFLKQIDPLDIDLVFLLEIDLVVELLERPLFRHLHVRMLEREDDPKAEGSGANLFKTLKELAMIIPQSTCFSILRDRLCSVSRFRQSTISVRLNKKLRSVSADTERYVSRVLQVRKLHCEAAWRAIRLDSLETPKREVEFLDDEGADKRSWLGYASKDEEEAAKQKYRDSKHRMGENSSLSIEEINNEYDDLEAIKDTANSVQEFEPNPAAEVDSVWKQYWADAE